MSPRFVNHRTVLILIMSVALLTRLVGLDWGLPHTYEEATPLRVAVSMWGWEHGGEPTLDPAFFNYPSLSFYVHFIVQGVLFLVLKLNGCHCIGHGLEFPLSHRSNAAIRRLARRWRVLRAVDGAVPVQDGPRGGRHALGTDCGPAPGDKSIPRRAIADDRSGHSAHLLRHSGGLRARAHRAEGANVRLCSGGRRSVLRHHPSTRVPSSSQLWSPLT
jgi:hypothetical protein